VSRPVRFAAEAERDLNELFDYITEAATSEIAGRYLDELIPIARVSPRSLSKALRATTSAPDCGQRGSVDASSSRSPPSTAPS
jgi:plasmid stabilization system protein ParE